jgi:hypothetical protein
MHVLLLTARAIVAVAAARKHRVLSNFKSDKHTAQAATLVISNKHIVFDGARPVLCAVCCDTLA